MDSRVVRCGIISSCQSADISKTANFTFTFIFSLNTHQTKYHICHDIRQMTEWVKLISDNMQ